MDEIVLRAMAKWPNVPAVYGWLSLNQRGQWLIKDEPVVHPLMAEFIGRNYQHDQLGRWYFQNGPQRVYVKLAYAPFILRIPEGDRLVTHTGLAIQEIRRAWLDSCGALVLETEHGPGMMDDRDAETLSIRLTDAGGQMLDDDTLLEALERLQQGERSGLLLAYRGQRVELLPIEAAQVPERLGFVRDPQPVAGEEAGT